jgi:hypothetical protein
MSLYQCALRHISKEGIPHSSGLERLRYNSGWLLRMCHRRHVSYGEEHVSWTRAVTRGVRVALFSPFDVTKQLSALQPSKSCRTHILSGHRFPCASGNPKETCGVLNCLPHSDVLTLR